MNSSARLAFLCPILAVGLLAGCGKPPPQPAKAVVRPLAAKVATNAAVSPAMAHALAASAELALKQTEEDLADVTSRMRGLEMAARTNSTEVQALYAGLAASQKAYETALLSIPEVAALQARSLALHGGEPAPARQPELQHVDAQLMDAELVARTNNAEVVSRFADLTGKQQAYRAKLLENDDLKFLQTRREELSEQHRRLSQQRGRFEQAGENPP
jgi:hypothetical protein